MQLVHMLLGNMQHVSNVLLTFRHRTANAANKVSIASDNKNTDPYHVVGPVPTQQKQFFVSPLIAKLVKSVSADDAPTPVLFFRPGVASAAKGCLPECDPLCILFSARLQYLSQSGLS